MYTVIYMWNSWKIRIWKTAPRIIRKQNITGEIHAP